MKKIVVLGAGLVGREVARDLDAHFDVTSVEKSPERLEKAATGWTMADDARSPPPGRRASLNSEDVRRSVVAL